MHNAYKRIGSAAVKAYIVLVRGCYRLDKLLGPHVELASLLVLGCILVEGGAMGSRESSRLFCSQEAFLDDLLDGIGRAHWLVGHSGDWRDRRLGSGVAVMRECGFLFQRENRTGSGKCAVTMPKGGFYYSQVTKF